MKKLLAILMAAAMLLSLCACGGEKDETANPEGTTAASEEKPEKEDSKKKAEKIEELTTDRYITGYNSVGFTYEEDNMTGLISYDGTNDTGAIYYNLESEGNYFVAETKLLNTPEDLDSINNMILIDSFGKQVISDSFCDIEMISDKFAVVAKAVEMTSKNDEYDFFISSNMFKFSADEEDICYDADFYVYDVTTGQKIEGLASSEDDFSAFGDIIKCGHYSFNSIYVNSKGEPLPEDAEEIESFDGFYIIEENESGTIYDAFGNAVFTYNTKEGYVPLQKQNGYLICKDSANGTIALFDETGTMASAEIPVTEDYYRTEVHGNLIVVYNNSEVKDCIYDFEGNVIKECSVYSVNYNEDNITYFTVETDDEEIIIISPEGEILYEASAKEAEEINSSVSGGSKTNKGIDGVNYYFCVKDKDFTLKGSSIGSSVLVAVENSDGTVDAVNSVTGKTVVDGYKSYSCAINGEDTYILAKTENGYDLYKI